MNKMLTDLKLFFKEDGWNFTEIEGSPALRLPFRASNGEWLCYAQAREDQDLFVFYSICPLRASEAQRMAMAEFITRANYGLLIGSFEMDFNDGQIRYKTGFGMNEIKLTPEVIQPVVYANVLTLEHYLPGIIAILNGGKTPSEAVKLVEQQVIQSHDA